MTPDPPIPTDGNVGLEKATELAAVGASQLLVACKVRGAPAGLVAEGTLARNLERLHRIMEQVTGDPSPTHQNAVARIDLIASAAMGVAAAAVALLATMPDVIGDRVPAVAMTFGEPPTDEDVLAAIALASSTPKGRA